ncbi:MAG TPA: hypothetical protein VGR71_17055, partial [Nitrospira sp.]|nr:hypothetical protein [Nitrospira sp.]
NEATAKKQLGDEVQALGEQCRDTWSNIADPRITGILFHVITPSHIQDINLLTVAQQTVVFSLPNRAEPEVELLRRFADIIGN